MDMDRHDGGDLRRSGCVTDFFGAKGKVSQESGAGRANYISG